jgi:hypothetical protein
VAARDWLRGIGRRRRATAPRTATGAGLLAARGRAGGEASRATLVVAPRIVDAEAFQTVDAPLGPTPPAASPTAPASREPQGPQASQAPQQPPAPVQEGEMIARLREAKRRSRER